MRFLYSAFSILHARLLALLGTTLAACALGAQTAPIVPLPAKIVASETAAGKTVTLTAQHAIVCADANFAALASDTIHKWTNLRLKTRPDQGNSAAPSITITLDPAPAAPEARNPEGYSLGIAETGDIAIIASAPAGAFYALQTLAQLLAASPPGQLALPVVTIHDAPRFGWRGVLADDCRHFLGADGIKRLLDTMALFKFNKLHWHLTDDQGWRIEIKKYPRLTQIGSWRASSPTPMNREKPDGVPHGGYYTQEQIREIVAYAKQRHITIVPEIEIPGHSAAALAAYPQFGNDDIPGYAPEVQSTMGVKPYTYAPKEETFAFLFDILAEVCALFPGEYIHIGGDEAPKKQWEASPFAQSVMRKNNLKNGDELQSWFLRRVEKHLAERGRKIIGWDEIQEGGLSPTAVMMVWRDWKWARHALDLGNNIIMTPRTHCYIDYTPGNLPENDPYYDNITRYQKTPRVITLEKVYHFEPVSEGIRPGQETQILGSQANLWGEYLYDWRKAEYFLYPRALAMSEALWRPRDARDWRDFQARLPAALRLLDKLGVNHQPLVDALKPPATAP